MFKATCIGHHAWHFSAGSANILVDPVLFDSFGHTASVGLRVYPPRSFDFNATPRFDAVMLTHEHEGHFDLPSLNVIDRSVPIYISCRCSAAAKFILREMGFQVYELEPGVSVDLGDLLFMPITPNQARHAVIEEWDSLAYFVWDKAGHGNFFTNLDMPSTPEQIALVMSLVEKPGFWALTNNYHQWNFLSSWLSPHRHGLERVTKSHIKANHMVRDQWARPEVSMLVGGGFAMGGDQAFFNTCAFPFEHEELMEGLVKEFPNDRFYVPRPGETLVMENGGFVGVEYSDFVKAKPKELWPVRGTGALTWLETYTPVTGVTELPDSEHDALQHALDSFATHLYGRKMFKELLSLSSEDLQGRRPTIALLVKADDEGGAFVYEYRSDFCDFNPVQVTDPVATYLAVYEVWATDLLAFFRCELGATGITFGRHRLWNAIPEKLTFAFNYDLFEYINPLRFPAKHLDLYRRVLSGCEV